MRRMLFWLAVVAMFSGCSIASESYRPGLRGVRDDRPADFYVGRSGIYSDSLPLDHTGR